MRFPGGFVLPLECPHCGGKVVDVTVFGSELPTGICLKCCRVVGPRKDVRSVLEEGRR